MISNATQRSIFRWIHIVFAIPILGYIYSPFDQLPNYAPATRFVFLPVMVLTDCGCGKATSFDDLFRKERPKKMLHIAPSRGWPTQARFWLEWGSSTAGQSVPAALRVFGPYIPTRSLRVLQRR